MDYTLYPIKNADVNWPLYYMVSHFLKLRYELDEVRGNDVGIERMLQSLYEDVRQEKRNCHYCLVFPFDDLTVSYNEAMLEQEAIILKCFSPIEHPDPQYIGDDENFTYEEVPMEYFHFEGNGKRMELKHFYTDLLSQFPNCVFNGDAFLEAVNRLLAFLREKQLTELVWYSRLQTVAAMLDGNANELHILHNAGLFDHQTLWPQLEQLGVPKAEIEKVKEPYLTQLHRYAMFVLNELDWHRGSPIKKEDREKRWGLFGSLTKEQLTATVEEQERRLDMMQGKCVRPEVKIVPPVPPQSIEKNVKTPEDDDSLSVGILLVVIIFVVLTFAGLFFWKLSQ